MKSGEIILVPFPFTDLSSVKTRPALILVGDLPGGDIIICAISSKTSGKLELGIDNKSLKKGKLPISSYIKYSKLVTLDRKIVRKKVAYLKPEVFKKVEEKLVKLIQKYQ